jgi:predicted aldo/keto reductase-like oxidoreductase
MGKTEEIFEKQLEKCQVDYFDFYLFHNVSDGCIDEYLDEKYGTYDYLIKQKRKGRIRHLGFSTHASNENFLRFLDAYGDDMEFCQIQLNWWDWDFQDAKTKVRILRERNIPVWVMEPVRGGSLASLPVAYEAELKKLRPNASMAEWAFRFLQSIPEVAVTLSGMSNFAQLQENIETYRETAPLNEREKSTLFSIAKAMTDANRLPCTACRYCVEHCPMELEIPSLIDLYNEYAHASGGVLAPNAIRALEEDKRPSACVGCRACEKVCPQNIKISEMMRDFTAKLQ